MNIPGRRGLRGFTLVELMLSLAIVAIIMVGLLTAMRSFGVTDEKLERRLAMADERRVVTAFLEDVLGRAVLRSRLLLAGKPEESVFIGGPDSLEWVGVMPARHGVGGLHHFRLYWVNEGRGAALMLAYLPFNGMESMPDWSAAEQRVLLRDVSGFAVRYQLDDGGPWLTEWRNTTDPRRVQRVGLALAAGGSEWPLFVVQVRGLVSEGGMGRIVNGP